MRFLVDAQLPPALARWLAAKGHAAEHVADCEMQAASDAAIWAFAVEASAVIVTKDVGLRPAKGAVRFRPGCGLDPAAQHQATRASRVARSGAT